ELTEGARKADVMIYPLLLVGTASQNQLVVEISDDALTTIDSENGTLFPAARNAGARFAGKTFALPLGCSLPALISAETLETPESWAAYDQVVADQWKGAAAEPTAKGWAGAMFLWRAMDARKWLFSRDGLEPLVASEPYVAALTQMVQTHDRYEQKHQTPGQIWKAVASGELKGGIGLPEPRSAATGEIQVFDLPGASELSKVLLDPFSPVLSLSANCRQTAVAKRFMDWMSGGEGSQNVRMQVPAMNELRGKAPASGDAALYDQWLATRLQSPLTVPTLQLLRGADYYAVLDEQVLRALDGVATPADALKEVSEAWQRLNEEVGIEAQGQSWRRAQGMRT
ncbi:MAG: hypothetical protein ACR2NZ_22460, partial [Rubripirellula sp.]